MAEDLLGENTLSGETDMSRFLAASRTLQNLGRDAEFVYRSLRVDPKGEAKEYIILAMRIEGQVMVDKGFGWDLAAEVTLARINQLDADYIWSEEERVMSWWDRHRFADMGSEEGDSPLARSLERCNAIMSSRALAENTTSALTPIRADRRL